MRAVYLAMVLLVPVVGAGIPSVPRLPEKEAKSLVQDTGRSSTHAVVHKNDTNIRIPTDIHEAYREAVEQRYSGLVRSGLITNSYGLVFFPRVLEYYGSSYNRILDAGCGQCALVSYMQRVEKDGYGVEVSSASLEQKDCPPLLATGRVTQSSLAAIPFPEDHFDLVFSSDVLEHIPEFDIQDVVQELVRVSKGDVFLSISLRRASADPPPPAPAVVHVTVKPRKWWDDVFKIAGCTVNKQALQSVLSGRKLALEPWLFSYRCKDRATLPMRLKKMRPDPEWSKNRSPYHLGLPKALRRRFQGSLYWPSEQ